MKKLILSVFLLSGIVLFSSTNAQAQFAVKGGANFANFNDTDASTDTRTGFMGGITYGFQVPFSPVSIQPGVFYAQKGVTSSSGLGDAEVKLDYIEIPVVAKVDFILDNPLFTPHVLFGPYVGFNINSDVEASVGDNSSSVNVEDQVRTTDFGVVVGAGADISRFNVGVRYSAGLRDVIDMENASAKNGVFSIVAGIYF